MENERLVSYKVTSLLSVLYRNDTREAEAEQRV